MFSHPQIWLVVGFIGQALFSCRFLLQWIESEKRKESYIPVAFWWLSIAGGGVLLSYAIWRNDPVFITGQAAGLFIYIRNLFLISKKTKQNARALS
jgi:lipid-A-disaccharide synthase-like uncharacterized protein